MPRGILALTLALAVFAKGAFALAADSGRIGPLRGFALSGNELFAWGDGLYHWTALTAAPSRIATGAYSEGGCAWDVDGDGRADMVVNEAFPSPALVWYQAPNWKRRVIARGIDSLDMIPAELLGRRGILLIHKRMQVRFFDAPKMPDGTWTETELYSFYTPSHEGGLKLADVNRDGRLDVIAGNYWMASPESWELPWRLHAIDTWTEREPSAQLSLGWGRLLGSGAYQRVAAQRASAPGRLAWFDVPPDPKQLWPAHLLGEDLALDSITIDLADYDGDGRTDIIAAERAGQGRVILFKNDGEGHFTPRLLFSGKHLVGIRVLAPGKLLAVATGGVSIH